MMRRLDNSAYVHADDPGEQGYPNNPRRISVTAEEATMLRALVAGLDVLEIGTGLGVSTCAMAETARHVWTCDTDPWVIENLVPGLVSNDNVSFVPRDEAGILEVDAVFVDGLHTEAAVLADIALACRVLRPPGGLLILHDAYLCGVTKAIKAAGLNVTVIDTEYGLGVVRL